MPAEPSRADDTGWARRFSSFTTAITGALPFGLDRVVAPTLVGFVLINSTTFGVDLAVLSLAHGVARWPLAAAVTAGYATAFAIGYVLNRVVNFRSHAAVGPQLAVYSAFVVVNYLVLVLGLTSWLSAAGVDYRLARVAAGACEVVYLYCVLRWIVFRDRPEPG